MELWTLNELISDRAVADISKGMVGVERTVYDILRKYLLRFNTEDGSFSAQTTTGKLIAEMNREIAVAISKSSLDSEISKFLVNFDEVGENVRKMHLQLNDIDVPQSLVNRQKAFAIDATTYSLREANVSTRMIDPVKRLLFQRVSTGASVLDTERELRQVILGDGERQGVLQRWVGQIARDSINQYEGTIHTAVANEFGLTAIRYVNSIVTDSRSQCKRWVAMGRIETKDLPSEINWAFQNGQGMIPETATDNFLINRGGYNCRHRAIPVK